VSPENTDNAGALQHLATATPPQFQGARYDSGAREFHINLGNVSQREAALLGQLVAFFCDPARAEELAAFKASEAVLELHGNDLRVITAEQFCRALLRRN
jgi:hypothetical protein